MYKQKKIIIAHIVSDLTYGGVESFLYNYISILPARSYEHHIISYKKVSAKRRNEFEKIGCYIHTIQTKHQHSIENFTRLKQLYIEVQPDIIHSHLGISGYAPLIVAKLCKIKQRICHAHTVYAQKTTKQKISAKLSSLFATTRVACSKEAAKHSFGTKKYTIIKNAIDIQKFQYSSTQRKIIREKLHINANTKVYGHIGRLEPVKNQAFLLRTFKKINQNKNSKLLIIGSGALEKKLKDLCTSMKLDKSVIFISGQEDISAYYSAMDVFLLPSSREGLGITLIEAQANELPCIVSENIPEDAIITSLITKIPLKNQKTWQKTAISLQRPYNKEKILVQLEKHGYDIKKERTNLINLYNETSNWLSKTQLKVSTNKKIIYTKYCFERLIFSTPFIFFALLSFFGLPGLSYYETPYLLLRIAFAFCSVVILAYYGLLILTKNNNISKIQRALLLYFGILLISTLFNTRNVRLWFTRYILHWFSLSIYVESLILKCKEKFFDILNVFCLFLIILQLASIIIFPDGIVDLNITHNQTIYLLGYDNATTITMTLGALFTIYHSYRSTKKYLSAPSLIAVIAASLSLILTWSATGVVAVALLILSISLLHFRKCHKTFNMKNYILLSLIAFLSMVILRLQNIFSIIIEGLLHKNLTFTGRTKIWDLALTAFSKKPLLGLGVNTNNVVYGIIGAFHAHSTFLNIMLEGGIIGFIAYLNIFRTIWKQIKTCLLTTTAQVMSFGILIYFISGLMEVYSSSQMLIIYIVILFYTPFIEKHQSNNN